MITVDDLHVWYKKCHVIRGVSLAIHRHEITALIGASGSGKSTFLRCINRMVDTIPYARVCGSIILNGANVLLEDTDVTQLRSRVGMLFQNPTPFPKSIYQNISFGLEIKGMKSPYRGRSWFGIRGGRSAHEVETSQYPMDRMVVQSLKDAALWEEVRDRLHISAYRLSGGQQQRLCLARSLATMPDVLLLDEPCSELDHISTHRIEETLLRLKERYTIVIVTHNLQQARRISDCTIFFHDGCLVEAGRTDDVFKSPRHDLTRDYVRGNFG